MLSTRGDRDDFFAWEEKKNLSRRGRGEVPQRTRRSAGPLSTEPFASCVRLRYRHLYGVLAPQEEELFRGGAVRVRCRRLGPAHADGGRTEAADAGTRRRGGERVRANADRTCDPATQRSGISQRFAICGGLFIVATRQSEARPHAGCHGIENPRCAWRRDREGCRSRLRRRKRREAGSRVSAEKAVGEAEGSEAC